MNGTASASMFGMIVHAQMLDCWAVMIEDTIAEQTQHYVLARCERYGDQHVHWQIFFATGWSQITDAQGERIYRSKFEGTDYRRNWRKRPLFIRPMIVVSRFSQVQSFVTKFTPIFKITQPCWGHRSTCAVWAQHNRVIVRWNRHAGKENQHTIQSMCSNRAQKTAALYSAVHHYMRDELGSEAWGQHYYGRGPTRSFTINRGSRQRSCKT